MRQSFCQFLTCAVTVVFVTANTSAMAHSNLLRISDPSMCVDSMETVPADDDLDPTPIAVDGGCMVSEGVISI